jgi:beta-glucosidase
MERSIHGRIHAAPFQNGCSRLDELRDVGFSRRRLVFCAGAAAQSAATASAPAASAVAAGDAAVPRSQPLPVEQRVADLLSRMTLEEKSGATRGHLAEPSFMKDPSVFFLDEKGNFLPDRAAVLLKNGLGEMTRPSEGRSPRETADFTNQMQKWIKDNTRLGIPVSISRRMFAWLRGAGEHGISAGDCSRFHLGHAIGRQHIFAATAAEVRARGATQCLTPVLDLARDPRWGRTEETYGEDPYLVSRIGVAAIEGFQGPGPGLDASHVFATAKHFAVHGQPEGGTNVAPGNYSERVIREYFLKPFQAAVEEAHVGAIMASYNEIDGIPSHSNTELLTGILRDEWGFQGVVVSDYFGITDLKDLHHVVATNAEAAKMALEAGVDIELPSGNAYNTLVDQVHQGLVSEAMVDRAVARVLRMKFLTGLFDNPYVDPAYAEKITNSPEHQQLALKAAHEAIILLKNQNNLLPLDASKYKTIAVIGPNAADVHLGGYSDTSGRRALPFCRESRIKLDRTPRYFTRRA